MVLARSDVVHGRLGGKLEDAIRILSHTVEREKMARLLRGDFPLWICTRIFTALVIKTLHLPVQLVAVWNILYFHESGPIFSRRLSPWSPDIGFNRCYRLLLVLFDSHESQDFVVSKSMIINRETPLDWQLVTAKFMLHAVTVSIPKSTRCAPFRLIDF